MNKKRVFVILVMCALILGACFSPWKGDEGTFSINIGGGRANGRALTTTEENDDFIETSKKCLYTITLSGPGPEQPPPLENRAYGHTENFSVKPGLWTITITALLDGEIYATGSGAADIKPGPNGDIRITMTMSPQEPPEPPDVPDTFTVTFKVGDFTVHTIDKVPSGSTITAPTPPGIDGNFLGWYTDPEEGKKWDFATDAVTSNITLYARWEQTVNDGNITFEIDFEQIKDIDKPVIQKIIYEDITIISRIIVELKDPGQYNSIYWYINGITGSGPVFILDLRNASYSEDEEFHLTVEVVAKEDNKPYSQTFIIVKDKLPPAGEGD